MIGVLHVGSLTPRVFTDEDAELLQLAADRAATSIERARLFHQRGVVEALQQSLVPERLPIVARARAGGALPARPCGAAASAATGTTRSPFRAAASRSSRAT